MAGHRTAIRILGILQILIGLLCISLNTTEIINSKRVELIGEIVFLTGYGVWGGILFLLSGVFGFACSLGSTKRALQTTFLVFSVSAAAVSLATVSMAASDVVLGLLGYVSDAPTMPPKHNLMVRLGMASTLLALNVIGGIVSLACSIVCCVYFGCCCCPIIAKEFPVGYSRKRENVALPKDPKDKPSKVKNEQPTAEEHSSAF